MLNLNTSNPALTNDKAFDAYDGGDMAQQANVATLQGVVNKTGILTMLAVLAGAVGYAVLPGMPSLLWISAIASFIICLGIGFVLCGNPALAPKVAWIYAVVEGFFLGALTHVLDETLQGYLAANAKTSALAGMSLALPAFIITVCVLCSMLGLYSAGIIRPTARFKAALVTATVAVMLIYIVGFVLGFFGISLPFISINSAMQGGTAGLIGLGINVVILGIAGLWLIIDFGMVEEIVEQGSPKYMEWYGGFALLVTLAWIYYEAVKLSFRLAILFANRE